ncbi:MAG: T9SS type A sorting domain-containing protein [Bacteroidales bacterium]|jgi:hypothetical protein|nr:T9SS type A sorting domain-containing protein [Bacteroidales bacterium]
MKKLLLTTTLFAIAFATNAQTLQLGVKGKHIENNSELYYFGTPWLPEFSEQLKLYLLLTNRTNSAISVEGHFVEVGTPTGAITEWCIFGNCWPTPFLAPTPMAANFTEGLDDMFYLQSILNSSFEPATYTVHFNVAGNPDNNVTVKIHLIHRDYIPNDLPSAVQAAVENLENDTVIFVSGGYDVTSNRKLFAETPTIAVFPNPVTNGELRMENGEWKIGDIVEIFDMNGKRVYSHPAPRTSYLVPFSINISHLPTGNYILRMGTSTGSVSGVAKIVKH